jgi:hypothetical protein
MSAISSNEVQRLVREFVTTEIECEALDDETSRVGCITPLEYDNGDSVVVWVELWGDQFTISDYGEAFQSLAARPNRDITDFVAELQESSALLLGLRLRMAHSRRGRLKRTSERRSGA